MLNRRAVFSMFINDMPKVKLLPCSKFVLYADDTAIFCNGRTWKEVETKLQDQLNVVMKWLKNNSMFLNVEKTKVMMFGSQKKLRQGTINLHTNDGQLEVVHNFKYLGVILDSGLKWTKQTENVVSKISRIIGVIRKIKYYVTKENLIDLYYSLILPYIDYCIVIWGNTSRTNLTKIQRVQNRYARIVLNESIYCSSSYLLSTLNWQSITKRIEFQQCLMVYKILHNRLPSYLNRLISNRPVYYSTRYAINSPLFVPTPRTEYMKHSLSFKGSSVFNKLPFSVQSSPSLDIFRKQCRIILS